MYQDKNYEVESAYIRELLLRHGSPQDAKLLEIGTGTGKHAAWLMGSGFSVLGVEPSLDMAALARTRGVEVIAGSGSALSDLSLGAKFDAVLSLFHVVSYITAEVELKIFLGDVSKLLAGAGSLVVFDVWHQDAVEFLGMETRIKRVFGKNGESAVRIAEPNLNKTKQIGIVNYEIFACNGKNAEYQRFTETHTLKYLGFDDVESAAAASGFTIVDNHEFLSKSSASSATWGVTYVLKAL
jgi:voltage-gated potassium channel Kch